MKTKLAIFHFNAIELFPPVLNLVEYLSLTTSPKQIIKIFTTHPPIEFEEYIPISLNIKIIRIGRINNNGFNKVKTFIAYNLRGILNLFFDSPDVVLYYETNSCLPALFNKTVFKKKFRLFIHYHEYMSPSDYLRTRFQAILHKWEVMHYPKVNWISHTNEIRLKMFLKDIGIESLKNCEILHNYPSISWTKKARLVLKQYPPVRFVYVGALSFEMSYIKEFIQWMFRQNQEFYLDIYTQSNITELACFLSSYPENRVRIRGFINYSELPDILPEYHVGLILYKGLEVNVINCAPNKLFEYLACGLDVWVDKAIVGVQSYYTTETYPKVIGMDFSKIDEIDWNKFLDRAGKKNKAFKENYEQEYSVLSSRILS